MTYKAAKCGRSEFSEIWMLQSPEAAPESSDETGICPEHTQALLRSILVEPDFLTLNSLYDLLLEKCPEFMISDIVEWQIAPFLIRFARFTSDESICMASLKCLSVWPRALPAITADLLAAGYCDLLLELLCAPSRAYDSYLLCGIKNLIQYYPPFRQLFPLKFQIAVLFEVCSKLTALTPVLGVELAACFDQIVAFTELSEETAEYAMKAFCLILVQRFANPANFAYAFALHGVLAILRSFQLSFSFRGKLTDDHLIGFLVQPFLIGKSASTEKVLATMITGQLCSMEIPDVRVAYNAIMEILTHDYMENEYCAVITGLRDIVEAAPESIKPFIQERLIPGLVDVIARSPYRAREELMRCIFMAIARVALQAVVQALTGDFVELVFSLFEAEESPDFLEFLILSIGEIIGEAQRLGLNEFLELMRQIAPADLHEMLLAVARDDTVLASITNIVDIIRVNPLNSPIQS
jgi:hypothetical protein